jgi:hypothetical protein
MSRYKPQNESYLYMHTRADKNTVFYIGVGSSINYQRAKESQKRNNIWLKIYNKTPIKVDIVLDNLTHRDANSWEEYLIGLYGRINNNTGSLCNMTNGGDGVKGWVISEQGRINMSNAKKGFKHTAEANLKNKIWHSIPIVQMTRQGEFIREWDSATAATNELGFKSRSKISDCCKGNRKTHKNFTWKYKNN